MAKVFRLTSGANLEHWAESNVYDPTIIDAIQTPNGNLTRKEPTSIPSPFARLDLINNAFRVISDNEGLEGNTVNHKMVSDVLDLLEISFNADSIKDLTISYWDREAHLNELLHSNNAKHRLYGETLQLYLNQDEKSFNFDALKGFYILKYQHKVIGGTSPLTMFFTSANDLSFANISLNHGDILFDGEYCPLYKRDVDFIKYIFSLFIAFPTLKSNMTYFNEYLEKTLKELNSSNFDLYNEINLFTRDNNYLANCKKLDTGVAGHNIEVLGIQLFKRSGDLPIENESQFVIHSQKYKSLFPEVKAPLVLQNNFNKPLKYTCKTSIWDINTNVPYFDEETNLDKRVLPGTVQTYPFLTVSDFLEPVLFEFDFPINSSHYFNGNLSNKNEDNGYALPITRKFFDFFSTEDLLNLKVDGFPMLEMSNFPNSVDVTLRIPINHGKDTITFIRKYDRKGLIVGENADPSNNKGIIEKMSAAITIYPFIQSDYVSEYRIGLYNTSDYRISLNYYDKSNHASKIIDQKERSNDIVKSKYDLVENTFEYVSINQFGYSNIILPKWTKQTAKTEHFTFAIDFGTTNTHIEYQVGYSDSKPFDILESDIQYQSLICNDFLKKGIGGTHLFISRCIEFELMPRLVNDKEEYNFPIRTSISHKLDLDKLEIVYPLMDYSIPFQYQFRKILHKGIIKTNLKWNKLEGNDANDVAMFLEELILLIKHKVLFNNGDLEHTKIKWSYPLSMSNARLNKLEKLFEDLVEKNLGDKVDVSKYSESLAPFQYLIKSQGISALNRPVASIDIGGGTVDVVVYHENEPQLLTSFKLGVNTLFGDGYNKAKSRNGFISIYEDLQNRLDALDPDLGSVGNSIFKNTNDLTDYSIFMFSLENNKELKEKNISISFSKMLAESGDQLIVFLLYYAAIIYHLAKIMKERSLDTPNAIAFSGNGSKILNVIDSSKKSKILSQLTHLIFNKVYNSKTDEIKIEKYPNPKEMTAKGMIYSQKDYNIRELNYMLLGDTKNTTTVKYDEISSYVSDIEKEFKSFVDLFFNLNTDFNFTDNFEINQSRLEEFRKFIKSQVKDELLLGINERMKELDGQLDTQVNESMFFYPLVGVLNSLSTYIHEN